MFEKHIKLLHIINHLCINKPTVEYPRNHNIPGPKTHVLILASSTQAEKRTFRLNSFGRRFYYLNLRSQKQHAHIAANVHKKKGKKDDEPPGIRDNGSHCTSTSAQRWQCSYPLKPDERCSAGSGAVKIRTRINRAHHFDLNHT